MLVAALPSLATETTSSTPYWVGLILAVILTAVALLFIWHGRGTEWGADKVEFLGISIGKLSIAAFLVLVGVLGAGASIAKLATIRSDNIRVAHVVGVDNKPKLPDLGSLKSDKEKESALGHYLLAWYDNAEVRVDEGTGGGVAKGDYFATIADADRAKNLHPDEIATLQDSTTALLKVVRVSSDSSVCQLEELAYDKYFAAHPNSAELVPVGEAVIAIPPREVDLRDDISDAEEHDQWTDVVSLSDRFLERHPEGFFAADVLFKKGQYELHRYRASAATFRKFLDTYPFHASAPGAREWKDRAEAKGG